MSYGSQFQMPFSWDLMNSRCLYTGLIYRSEVKRYKVAFYYYLWVFLLKSKETLLSWRHTVPNLKADGHTNIEFWISCEGSPNLVNNQSITADADTMPTDGHTTVAEDHTMATEPYRSIVRYVTQDTLNTSNQIRNVIIPILFLESTCKGFFLK